MVGSVMTLNQTEQYSVTGNEWDSEKWDRVMR